MCQDSFADKSFRDDVFEHMIMLQVPFIEKHLRKSRGRMVHDIAVILKLLDSTLDVALRSGEPSEVIIMWSSLFLAVSAYQIAVDGKATTFPWRGMQTDDCFEDVKNMIWSKHFGEVDAALLDGLIQDESYPTERLEVLERSIMNPFDNPDEVD